MAAKQPKKGDTVRVLGEVGLHRVYNIYSWGGSKLVVLEDGRKVWLSNLITQHQRTLKVYVIQQNFGDRWEDVTEEETARDGRRSLRDYINGTTYPTRLITRREPNDIYQE